jgi:hypothetical protein
LWEVTGVFTGDIPVLLLGIRKDMTCWRVR